MRRAADLLIGELAQFVGPSSRRMDRALGPSLTFHLRGVAMTAAEGVGGRSNSCILVAEMEASEHDLPVDEWQTLLDGNAVMHGALPRFARDPKNGRPVLVWPCDAMAVSAIDAFRRAEAMAECASDWQARRAVPVLHQPEPGGDTDAAHDATIFGSRFAALHEGLVEAMGAPVQLGSPDEEPEGHAFLVEMQGARFMVSHLPRYRRDAAAIAMPLGNAHCPEDAHDVIAIMNTNYFLGMRIGGPLICRDPVSGGFLLRVDDDLRDANPQGFLHRLSMLAPLGRDRPPPTFV